MPNETARQELLQDSERSTSRPVNEINKFRKVFLPLLIICIACAPIAYLLSLLITEVLLSQEVCHKRIVGYYSVAEWNKLTVKQIEKLTHLIFMFAAVRNNGSLKVSEGPYEISPSDMKQVISVARKSESLKVMIAIGEFEPHVFNMVHLDSVEKKNFMNSISQLFEEYDIDGIEIFWMFVSEKDKLNHLKLIREVRQHLTSLKNSKGRTEDYVLSTTSFQYTESRERIDNKEVSKYVDFTNVLSYDFLHSNYYVGPVAPLYGNDSIDNAMNHLVCQTGQPSKLNIGFPVFGLKWRNTSLPIVDNRNAIFKRNNGTTPRRYFFRRDEEAEEFSPSDVFWHEKSQTPYMFQNNTFVSFESERSVQAKAKYIREKNIGGIAIFAIHQDDKNILMNAIKSVDLCSGEDPNKIHYDC